MSVAGIIGGLLLAGISLVYLGLPFIKRRAVIPAHTGQQLELMATYERIVGTVRDLDEDYQVGKLAYEQYAAEREAWIKRGTSALEALDKLGVDPIRAASKGKAQSQNGQAEAGHEHDAIEEAVAAYIRAHEQLIGQSPSGERSGD